MFERLQATETVDSEHARVVSFARAQVGSDESPAERAVKLYYAVRDGIRYDPYSLDLTVPGLRASTTLEAGRGWCVTKSILLAACCRAQGIPARLGFADVKNHLSTERLRKHMGTDVFYWHGYTALHLDGQWVKATPAFNIELCEKFRIKPLDFNGREDSIYHPFDLEGRKHMEYLNFRGEYDDVPLEEMIKTFIEVYRNAVYDAPTGDFDEEVEQETGDISGSPSRT